MLDVPLRIDRLCQGLLDGFSPRGRLDLVVGDCRIGVQSDSAELISRLSSYFRHWATGPCTADILITAVEMAPPDLALDFQDWKRDPGKLGRKDAFADLPDGRVVRKVRTGMQFLMTEGQRLTVGPCLENNNQVINFVVNQYISWLLRRGSVLCHAAGVARGSRGLALVGASGGGKSTLALHLISRGLDFVSNDRLPVHRDGGQARMAGVPKLPRINPGTVLNNPDLATILPPGRAKALSRLAPKALWELEEKYDVDIEAIYGPNRIQSGAQLDAFVILNWRLDNPARPEMHRVDLTRRNDLLAAIMKPPGPFHQGADGWSMQSLEDLSPRPYIEQLSDTPIYEISGGVNFSFAIERCLGLLT